MSDMKLIMEGWRQYSSQRNTVPMVLVENGELICFDLNERLRSLNESNNSEEINILFEKWIVQTEAMLNENVVTDFFGDVKEKAAKLTGQAKQFFTDLVDDPYLTLSLQLWSFLQKAKNVGIKMITRIASIVTKINNARKQFKRKNPKLYAFLDITVKVAAVFLVVALLTAAADADVALAGVQGVPEAPSTILQPDHPGAQAVIGIVKQTNPDLANEVARAISDPQMTDYSTLTPDVQQAISEAVTGIQRAVEIGTQGGADSATGGAAQQALEKFATEGRSILDNLAEQMDTLKPLSGTYSAGSPELMTRHLVDQLTSGTIKQNIDPSRAMEIFKQLKELGTLSSEQYKQLYDGVNAVDVDAVEQISAQLKAAAGI